MFLYGRTSQDFCNLVVDWTLTLCAWALSNRPQIDIRSYFCGLKSIAGLSQSSNYCWDCRNEKDITLSLSKRGKRDRYNI